MRAKERPFQILEDLTYEMEFENVNTILCFQMLLLLVLLIQWRLPLSTSSPTLVDDSLPTDEGVFSDLISLYRGQPEQEISLSLPTDEEALNEIKPALLSGNSFYYIDRTGRLISSSFPGIIKNKVSPRK